MQFFKKLWQLLQKTPSKVTPKPSNVTTNAPKPIAGDLFQTSELLKAYHDNEATCLDSDTILNNLRVLKGIVDAPKEEKLELRFSKIQQHLGEPEAHETVRQERWYPNIYCPQCKSINLNRLPQIPPRSPYNYKYQCLDCKNIFHDDTGTPLEQTNLPLQTWMQCWYLMGCTDSISYIANKLGLDSALVEQMIIQLKKAFGSTHPLSRFKNHLENGQQMQALKKQLQESLSREYEKLNANIATVPHDSAEFRKQQEIRRQGKIEPKKGR